MLRVALTFVLLAAPLGGCGTPERPLRLEDVMRVGVDPADEAQAVERTLVAAGYERDARLEREGLIALGFSRSDGRRAVRVITERGVVAALDSHEPDGLRARHGDVRLRELEPADVDGDGQPEVIVARHEEHRVCLAVLRVSEDGRVAVAETDAGELAPGACVEALEDIDHDGVLEAIVPVAWPELGVDGIVPSVRAVLVVSDGTWRADAAPVAHQRAEEGRRREALEVARARLDVAASLRLAIELAALAHLSGAAPSAQVQRFDAALAGLVLSRGQLLAVDRARSLIAAGWRPRGSRDTPAPRSDGQEEEDPG